jgi:hypothetical protein
MSGLASIFMPFVFFMYSHGCPDPIAPNIEVDSDGISTFYPDLAEFHYSKEAGKLLISLQDEDGSWSDMEFDAVMTEQPCKAVILDMGGFDCAIINMETGTTNIIINGINRKYCLEHCSRL